MNVKNMKALIVAAPFWVTKLINIKKKSVECIPSTKPKEYGRQSCNQRSSCPNMYSLETHPRASPPPGNPPDKMKLRKTTRDTIVIIEKSMAKRRLLVPVNLCIASDSSIFCKLKCTANTLVNSLNEL